MIRLAAIGTTIASDSRVPCEQDLLQPLAAAATRRCRRSTGNSTPFNWLVSRWTPEMIRSAGAQTATAGLPRNTPMTTSSSW